MLASMHATFDHEYAELRQRFEGTLRAIARQSVKSWFNQNRLDKLLAERVGLLEDCELIYAMDADGRQVSSNVQPNSIDPGAYGQDLSRRPYVVSLAALNSAAFRGAFLCDAYVSRATQHPCVTLMYRVTSGPSLLGYIAADFKAVP